MDELLKKMRKKVKTRCVFGGGGEGGGKPGKKNPVNLLRGSHGTKQTD